MISTNCHAARSRSMHFPGNRVDSASPPSSAQNDGVVRHAARSRSIYPLQNLDSATTQSLAQNDGAGIVIAHGTRCHAARSRSIHL
jgi:hypothetical protein